LQALEAYGAREVNGQRYIPGVLSPEKHLISVGKGLLGPSGELDALVKDTIPLPLVEQQFFSCNS